MDIAKLFNVDFNLIYFYETIGMENGWMTFELHTFMFESEILFKHYLSVFTRVIEDL